MEGVVDTVARLTSPDSNESWDFEEVMNKPLRIIEANSIKLLRESEKYIEEL